MEDINIIIRPLVTEKTTHQQQANNTYAFEVALTANKMQVRQAVERLYKVKVRDVRTMARKGKPRRSRNKMAHTGHWKRAIVTLAEDSRIELF
jgi:large subunit ribosomal protein L23